MKKNTFKHPEDFRTSLEARLQKEARVTGIDLQNLRRRVAFDRLLARLFAKPQASFFLKGGYAMELRFSMARTTKDIDLTCLKRFDHTSDFQLDYLQELAAEDLKDFFSYRLETAKLDLTNAPYGGHRYPVISHVGGRPFVRFNLDVGGDVLVSETELLNTPDWLSFCNIPPPKIRMIALEQQFAEKIHAYTLFREERVNTRVKDLIDLVLLIQMRSMNIQKLSVALNKTFAIRNSHSLPQTLCSPPISWETPYTSLAIECGLKENLMSGFQIVDRLYKQIMDLKKICL